MYIIFFFFFFQAEDGIRDFHVTGVQTCALPISATAALRRTQAHTFVAAPEPTPPGPVVLLLSPDLDVQAQTPETHDYLRILLPSDDDRSPVPASVYNVAAQLRAAEVGVDANPPRARVHLSSGRWLTLRAA